MQMIQKHLKILSVFDALQDQFTDPLNFSLEKIWALQADWHKESVPILKSYIYKSQTETKERNKEKNLI